jgi:acetyltransferase-like isoleucine patch superfamily enzyme
MQLVKRLIKYYIFFGFVDAIYNFITLRLSRVNYKSNLIINGRIKIINRGLVALGDNVVINSGKNHNVIGGDIRTNFIVHRGAEFTVGNNSGLSNSTFVCSLGIVIESDVLVGGGCRFYDTDFHSIDYEQRTNPFKNGLADNDIYSEKILIKRGAWIGGGSIILKGITIGEKSIVGAGSVVSKNIPDGEIWAGNPIKYIRKL